MFLHIYFTLNIPRSIDLALQNHLCRLIPQRKKQAYYISNFLVNLTPLHLPTWGVSENANFEGKNKSS